MENKDSKKSKKVDIKSVAKKAVAGSVLSGVLLSSCVKDYLLIGYQKSDFFGSIKSNSIAAKHLLDKKSIRLSADFRDYFTIINFIVNDITTNRESAELFISNFHEYMDRQDLSHLLTNPDFKFEITEKDKRLLMAFTDEEIFTAVKNLDFERFLDLSLAKGYIVGPESALQGKSINDFRHFFKTQEDFDNYMDMLKSITNNQDPTTLSQDLFWPGAIAVGFAVVAGLAVAVATVVWFWVDGEDEEEEYDNLMRVGEKEPVLNLWFNTNPNTAIHYKSIIDDKLIVQQAQKIVEAISKINPNIDQKLLLDLVILNFNAYYYGHMELYRGTK